MNLEPDTHFNNIAVNTTYSSVHLPTNVFDKLDRVSNAILWSKKLDRIFKHNYRADPALMWQYFCSTTGVLRQYPAMRWPVGLKKDGEEKTDIYDCRVRSWYIEASTCSKDMVILVDNSGSMTGMSNTIGEKVSKFFTRRRIRRLCIYKYIYSLVMIGWIKKVKFYTQIF